MDTREILGLIDGDQELFNNCYRCYHQKIYGFVKSKTQSDFIAQEVVQLTFIRLWEKRKKINSQIAIDLQLFGMARQVMIDELRKEATRYKYNNEAGQLPFTESLIKMIESKDMLKHLEKELEFLPPIRKLVFNLSRKQGLTHQEIADMLGISPKTVENHIGKVLAQLKQVMLSMLL